MAKHLVFHYLLYREIRSGLRVGYSRLDAWFRTTGLLPTKFELQVFERQL
jgi:hypothetical protein